jgi:hypothetical protein
MAMSRLSFREYLLSRRRSFTEAGAHLTELIKNSDFLAVQSARDLEAFFAKHHLKPDAAVYTIGGWSPWWRAIARLWRPRTRRKRPAAAKSILASPRRSGTSPHSGCLETRPECISLCYRGWRTKPPLHRVLLAVASSGAPHTHSQVG